ncbi:MAG: serine/threonine protein kinase [Gammaproteobacteria bacterium]|nr:serine/threonine protein kinase [Gammaproteobacteria bacterium]
MPHIYEALTPDTILDAIEASGFLPDGRILALNSYENRVYQIGIEESEPLIAKFYRPQRWPKESILEEHRFTISLADNEIPVVAPMSNELGETLHQHQGFMFSLFPRRSGHWPELGDLDNLEWLGRFLGRIHAIGATEPFQHRPTIDRQSFGHDSYQYLLSHGFIPKELELPYRTLVEDVLTQVDGNYERAGNVTHIRLHGDCHPGNILWREDGPWFVDMDDCRMGPAVQDLWMLLSGEREEMAIQMSTLVEGYEQFMEFDRRELNLLEALRTLRLIHYSAWLARRWDDPAFQQAFPWFNTQRYWEEQILTLREQAAKLDEPPLPI